jgi:3-phenylpropionate/trans-cinnamate dioxygenase ferredoxin component
VPDLGAGDAIPNHSVVPHHLEERKLRISLTRVGDRVYGVDDLCTCADQACQLSGGLLTGTTRQSYGAYSARSSTAPEAPHNR